MSLKNPGTPPGNDPGIVRLVAQRLNHYATRGPKLEEIHENFNEKNVNGIISTYVRRIVQVGNDRNHTKAN